MEREKEVPMDPKRPPKEILTNGPVGADRGFAVLKQPIKFLHSRLAVAWTANKNFPEMISHQPWQGTFSAL
jgi:hypothetical protein